MDPREHQRIWRRSQAGDAHGHLCGRGLDWLSFCCRRRRGPVPVRDFAERLNPDELFEGQKKLAIESRNFEVLGLPFAPTLDHEPLSISKTIFDSRVQRVLERLPVFISYCRDEGAAFEGIFAAMNPDVKPSTIASVVDFISKSWFQDDSDKLWEQARAAGGETWFYELVFVPNDNPFKAAHALEMPFVLGGWDA